MSKWKLTEAQLFLVMICSTMEDNDKVFIDVRDTRGKLFHASLKREGRRFKAHSILPDYTSIASSDVSSFVTMLHRRWRPVEIIMKESVSEG